ncbi:MAG: oligosaccharide flippase family protein [Deltaproteobacteria bacterium]|nr:oligosaccharide flippase family protein [Deltaproteobacteria bacterium]
MSSFFKNILVVMTGTAIAQLIGFLLVPVISRLYSPSDFGVYGSFNAILGIIAAGVTLDYTQAIMLPKQKEDAFNLFVLSCVFTVLISTCCLAVCIFAPETFQRFMKVSNAWMLLLLVLAILVRGLNTSLQAWCVRVKAFKHTSASQVIRSISCNGTQIGFGYFKTGAKGLIIGSILANLLASLNLFRVLLPDLLAFRSYIKWDRIKRLAIDYRDFPMYSATHNVINALSAGLAVILLTHFYGIAVAGAYAFGFRTLMMPMRFVLSALRQVLFQKVGETQRRGGSLFPLYTKTTLGLFGLALFPALLFFVWGPQIFTLVFGPQWYMAGEFVQSLVLWAIFIFCNVPAVMFAKVIRIQRLVFIYNLWLLIARVSALVFGGLYLNAKYTVMLFALVGSSMNLILILLVGYAVMIREK